MGKMVIYIVLSVLAVVVLAVFSKKTQKLHMKFIADVTKAVIIFGASLYLFEKSTGNVGVSNSLMKSGSIIVAVATFAAQKALGNVISGFAISASKPYKIGEKIKVMKNGTTIAEGIITDMTLRHTIITTYDEQTEIVPNSLMDESVIVNSNFTESVGRFFEVQISYDSDIDKAISLLNEVCEKEPLVTKHNEPLVSRYEYSGIVLKATIFTESVSDNFKACSNIRKELITVFKDNDINIPYPIIDLKNLMLKQ